jgi:hypothetical protein
MFGFIIANKDLLSESQEEQYSAYYCGLCAALDSRFGLRYRITLSYDMCFLALVLCSLQEEESAFTECKCPKHPIKQVNGIRNETMDYVADMSVILTYYQLMDSWVDDQNIGAFLSAKSMSKQIQKLEELYPLKLKNIKHCLDELSKIEKDNVLNPDVASACFGELLSYVFFFGGIAENELLVFGNSLGKFIYIMDAVCDLRQDLKKQQYNPLIAIPVEKHKGILTALLAECTDKFYKLPVKRNKELMENILFSGVWTKYNYTRQKGGKK